MKDGAALLNEYMERKRLTRAAFAQQIGASAAAVSRYVNGRRSPDRPKAIAIEKVARIPVEAWTAE